MSNFADSDGLPFHEASAYFAAEDGMFFTPPKRLPEPTLVFVESGYKPFRQRRFVMEANYPDQPAIKARIERKFDVRGRIASAMFTHRRLAAAVHRTHLQLLKWGII